MNLATKAKIAGALTLLVTFVTVIQTSVTSPPFTAAAISIITGVCTYLALIGTTFKQYLSPDVSNTGAHVTIWVAIAATLTGFLDLMQWIHFSPIVSQYIKLGVSIVVMTLNILSKQIWPSELQKDKMADLKYQQPRI